jgi:hypothetical protein
MLVENVEPERRGQTLALAMSFISCGTVSGPAISGTMFQLAGYWAAWSVPLGLLGLDAVARLVMIEKSASGVSASDKTDDHAETPEPRESDSLLGSPAEDYSTLSQPHRISKAPKTKAANHRSSSNSFRDPWSDELVTTVPTSPPNFYATMLLNPYILAGLANTFGFSFILAAFDTTLPLFLRNTFGWGSMPVGLIFLGLQGPIIVLGPVVGGLRDRLGCRGITVVGWAMVAPFLSVMALVGRSEIPWLPAGGIVAEVVVVGCIAGIGVGFLLIRGGGAFQVIGMFSSLFTRSNIFLLTSSSCYERAGRSGSRYLRNQRWEFEGLCSDGDGFQCGYAAWAVDFGKFVGGLGVFLVELFYV